MVGAKEHAAVEGAAEVLGGSWTTWEPLLPPPPTVLAPAAYADGEAELDGGYFGGSTVTPLELRLLLPPGPSPLFPEEVPGPAHSWGDMVVVVAEAEPAEAGPPCAASPGP